MSTQTCSNIVHRSDLLATVEALRDVACAHAAESDLLSGTSTTPRIGHGGEVPGLNAFFEILPSLSAVVIVVANRDPPAASWIGEHIVQSLAQEP